MDLSQLWKLGKVGGVPGIALGVVALVVLAVIDASGTLPEAWRGPVWIVIVVGAVLLAAVAILGGRTGAQIARTEGDYSAASNRDKSKGGGSQHASTTGKNAPASNERG